MILNTALETEVFSKGIQDVCISALVVCSGFHVRPVQIQYRASIAEYSSSERCSAVVDELRILNPHLATFQGDSSTFSGKPLNEKVKLL